LGGIVVSALCPAIGVIGTYVIVIILCIICLVIITEKSFIRGVKKGSEKAYSSAKQDAKKRKEQAELRREKRAQEREQKAAEKERKRKDNTVSGVSFDTTLVKKSPEMREITPPEDVPDLFAEEIPSYDGREAEVSKNIVPDDITINRAQPIMEEEAPIPEPVPEKRKTKESKKQVETATANVEQEIKKSEEKRAKEYVFPPLSLLKHGKKSGGDSDAHLRQTAMKLQQTLQNFNVNVTVTNVSCGPSVTRYELQPEQGVKVSKIVGLADDIKLNLAAADIRIEAPIPGKAAVGIEVPNKENTAVMLRDLLETDEFQNHESKIAFAAGRDIAGKVVVADIMKMPHVLIAGATGSGKSVCINTLIMSILYKADPKDVKLIMIDPKVVELSVYNGIPHLMIPVVTDPKKAAGALNWAVAEMMKRYDLFAQYNVRDLKGYNAKVETVEAIEEEGKPEKLPQIVIIVDELADLMMVAPGEVEESICRLAQLARAAGIHLVLATQRPSVNVITGLIKANMPSRIAFSVSSGVDSRTIIDMNGAEKLLGKGDMLFYPAGYQKPARVQGAFVSDKEVQAVVDFLVKNSESVQYNEEITNHVNSASVAAGGTVSGNSGADDRDAYFVDAGKFIIEKDKASIGMLQRVFKIGFNRAARIMDQLAEAGVVGEEEGTKPRKVLMSMEQFEQYIEEHV
jgi:S-DNA-T family DNA segregation ATPase FtsK/SpoIIIE